MKIGSVQRVRLTNPALDFWVDVNVISYQGRWMAVATFCDEPEVGLGSSAREAIGQALAALGDEARDRLMECVRTT